MGREVVSSDGLLPESAHKPMESTCLHNMPSTPTPVPELAPMAWRSPKVVFRTVAELTSFQECDGRMGRVTNTELISETCNLQCCHTLEFVASQRKMWHATAYEEESGMAFRPIEW
eukprot:10814-Alexandrium_andersonii.AAC.1